MRKRAIGSQFALKKILIDIIKPMTLIFKYGAKIISYNNKAAAVLDTGWRVILEKTPENRLMIGELKTAVKARM